MCPDFSRVSAVYIIVCDVWSIFYAHCRLHSGSKTSRSVWPFDQIILFASFVLQPFRATVSIGIRSSHRSAIMWKSCCGATSHARLNSTSFVKTVWTGNIAHSVYRPISSATTNALKSCDKRDCNVIPFVEYLSIRSSIASHFKYFTYNSKLCTIVAYLIIMPFKCTLNQFESIFMKRK